MSDRSLQLAELAGTIQAAIDAIRMARTLAVTVEAPMEYQLAVAEGHLEVCQRWSVSQAALALKEAG
jgi:hypothetical protein